MFLNEPTKYILKIYNIKFTIFLKLITALCINISLFLLNSLLAPLRLSILVLLLIPPIIPSKEKFKIFAMENLAPFRLMKKLFYLEVTLKATLL